MLILSRKEGEKILIGNDIVVEVIDVRPGGLVRLGIVAPEEVEVDRSEVRDRKRREGERRSQK